MAVRRLFGVVADTLASGTDYDTLVAGAIPDATSFWPVTGGSVDYNIDRYDRNDEVRGRRHPTAPVAFRAAPVVTVPMPAYGSVLGRVLALALGIEGVTGAPPVSVSHKFTPLAYGVDTMSKHLHVQMVRDNLNEKFAGCAINRVTCNFPIDGEGTAEVEFHALYHKRDVAAMPTPSFTGLSRVPLMLRDAQVFIGPGAGTSVTDLQGFEFTWNNNLAVKHYARRNIASDGSTPPEKLWFPTQRRLGAMPDCTFRLIFGDTTAAEEAKRDWANAQKVVFETSGDALGSTPPASETLRFTQYASVYTGGGAENLSARDDITSNFEGAAFYSESDSKSVEVEYINSTVTALLA